MNKEEIIGKLKEAMKGSSEVQVDWDSVSEETTIESIGFDSLSILDLIYDIQQLFDIEFEAEAMVGVNTVGALADFLQGKLQS
jgi:acyl carrier protein